MMIEERVAYLKGLAEGLGLDETNKQDKLIQAIIDVLGDLADEVADMEDGLVELSDQLDAVDEDLADLEEECYGDDCCDCDCDEDEEFYEVVCPSCGEEICLDEEMLEEDGIDCPNCGTPLEFDFSCGCDDDDCDEGDCGCGCGEH